MKSIVPFILGVLLTCLVAYFGGNNYVSIITNEYKDSIKVERARNAFKMDSFSLLVDSLNHRKLKNDTILINLYHDEKASINAVDSLHDTNLVRSIKELLYSY